MVYYQFNVLIVALPADFHISSVDFTNSGKLFTWIAFWFTVRGGTPLFRMELLKKLTGVEYSFKKKLIHLIIYI